MQVVVVYIAKIASNLNKVTIMYNYKCFYKGNSIIIQADTSYQAQQLAAKQLKAKKAYDVTVMLLDTIHSTSNVG